MSTTTIMVIDMVIRFGSGSTPRIRNRTIRRVAVSTRLVTYLVIMTVLGLTFGAHTKFSILLTLLLGSLEVVHKFIMSESNLKTVTWLLS